jgi:hypothetical protein
MPVCKLYIFSADAAKEKEKKMLLPAGVAKSAAPVRGDLMPLVFTSNRSLP